MIMSKLQFNTEKKLSYYDKEKICDFLFSDAIGNGKEFWHVCTPGDGQELILRDREICEFAMNATWLSACDTPGLEIYTFEWMSNNFHALVSGTEQQARDFIEQIRKRLRTFSSRSGHKINLKKFVCSGPISIDSLSSFRNTVVYINRNNYVVDSRETPFSYPYGANGFFFNPLACRFANGKFGDLTVISKRRIIRSHNIEYPNDAALIDGYVSPVCYCNLKFAEKMFRDARHYFSMLSKPMESSHGIAELLGDKIYYTDDELFTAVVQLCKKDFGVDKPSMLDSRRKIEFSKRLHYDYNAGNSQIQRILHLDRELVDSLFPMSADTSPMQKI